MTRTADPSSSSTPSSSWGSRGLALAALLAVAGTGFVIGQGTDAQPVTLSTSGSGADDGTTRRQAAPQAPIGEPDPGSSATAVPATDLALDGALVVDLDAATAAAPAPAAAAAPVVAASKGSAAVPAAPSTRRRSAQPAPAAAPAPARAPAPTPAKPTAKRVIPGENDPPLPPRPVYTPPRVESPYEEQIVEAGRVTVSGSGWAYGGDIMWEIEQLNGTVTRGGHVSAGVYAEKYWSFTVDLVPGDATLTMWAPAPPGRLAPRGRHPNHARHVLGRLICPRLLGGQAGPRDRRREEASSPAGLRAMIDAEQRRGSAMTQRRGEAERACGRASTTDDAAGG